MQKRRGVWATDSSSLRHWQEGVRIPLSIISRRMERRRTEPSVNCGGLSMGEGPEVPGSREVLSRGLPSPRCGVSERACLVGPNRTWLELRCHGCVGDGLLKLVQAVVSRRTHQPYVHEALWMSMA